MAVVVVLTAVLCEGFSDRTAVVLLGHNSAAVFAKAASPKDWQWLLRD
jgi:hypothetical protein